MKTFSLELEGDTPEGLGALTIMLGQTCSGYNMGTVVSALMYLLADCAKQADVPTDQFVAEAYVALLDACNQEVEDGSSSYN